MCNSGDGRTAIIVGGFDKSDIAKMNEDVDLACDYCGAPECTADHIAWVCPHFTDFRHDTDPELPNCPSSICSNRALLLRVPCCCLSLGRVRSVPATHLRASIR